MSEIKIQIKNLYKIFGKNPKSALEQVKDGVNKDELLEKHNHVLGLKDINLDIKEKSIQVVMGLSGSGKSTLIRHINRLIEPTDGSVVVDGEDVLKMNDETKARNRKTIFRFIQGVVLGSFVTAAVFYSLTYKEHERMHDLLEQHGIEKHEH